VSIFKVQGNSTSPTADRITSFIEGALGRLYPGATEQKQRPEIIHERLAALGGSQGPGNVIIVLANRETVAELARADAKRPDGQLATLDQLRLEPVSPRSVGIPLYLFARAGTVEGLRRTPSLNRRMAVGVTARTRDLLNLDELKAILDPVLGSRVDIVNTTTDHTELRDRLLADEKSAQHVDIVAIYDDEPSLLLDAFLETYRSHFNLEAFDALRVQLVLLPLLPARAQSYTPELRRTGSGGATFAIMQDDKIDFSNLQFVRREDGGDRLIALAGRRTTSSAGADLPVVLSNMRRVLGDSAAKDEMAKLQQIVSFSYLAGLLTDSAESRCPATPSPSLQRYLLQALFADGKSLPKRLALWSNVEAARIGNNRATPSPETELILRMINDRLQESGVGQTAQLDYQKLVKVLAPKRDAVSLREQFSGDDGEIFRKAAVQVRTAVEKPTSDAQALPAARRAFLELLLRKRGPACELRGPGLFGEKGYDPFLYLSVIDSLISMHPTGAGRN